MWLFGQKKKELDHEKTYLRVEFMTAEQKGKKRQIIKKLQK